MLMICLFSFTKKWKTASNDNFWSVLSVFLQLDNFRRGWLYCVNGWRCMYEPQELSFCIFKLPDLCEPQLLKCLVFENKLLIWTSWSKIAIKKCRHLKWVTDGFNLTRIYLHIFLNWIKRNCCILKSWQCPRLIVSLTSLVSNPSFRFSSLILSHNRTSLKQATLDDWVNLTMNSEMNKATFKSLIIMDDFAS